MRNQLANNRDILNLDETCNQSQNTTMFFKTKDASMSNILGNNHNKELKFPDKILEVDEELVRQSGLRSTKKSLEKILNETDGDLDFQINQPDEFSRNILSSNKKRKMLESEIGGSPIGDKSSLDISIKFEVTPNLKKLLKRKNHRTILAPNSSSKITPYTTEEEIFKAKKKMYVDADTSRNEIERRIDIQIKSSLVVKDKYTMDYQEKPHHRVNKKYTESIDTSRISAGKDPLKGKFLTNLVSEHPSPQRRILDKLEVIHQMEDMKSVEAGQKFISLKISDSFDQVENKKIVQDDISEIRFGDAGYDDNMECMISQDVSKILREDVEIKKLPLNRIKDQAPYYSIVTIQRNNDESYGSNYSYGGEIKSFLRKIRDSEYKKGSNASRGFRDYLGECKDQTVITNVMRKQISDMELPKKRFTLDPNRKSN